MDILKELYDLKETVGNKIAEANKKIRKTNGVMDMSDIEIVDKLAHSMKSLVSTCAMLEAEENGEGYSGHYGPVYYPGEAYGYSGRERRDDGYSGNRGGYSRNESRYSRENRYSRDGGYSRNGYSRTGDMTEQLRQMMEEAPDEMTRMEIKKLMDRMENQR